MRENQVGQGLSGMHRDVSFGGEAARRWLGNIGWSRTGPSDSLRVLGDHFADDAVAISRVWTTAGTLAPIDNGNEYRVILVVDGVARIRCGEWSAIVGDGDLLFIDSGSSSSIEIEGALGFLQFSAADDHLAPFRSALTLPSRFSIPETAPLFATMINAVFASQWQGGDGTRFLARSFENAIAASISSVDVPDTSPDATPRADAAKVLRVIAEHHRDPDFTVTELAVQMQISRRHLLRILSAHGTGPASAIRAARLTTAQRELLDRGAERYSEEIARAAGFRNLRGLRRARHADLDNALDGIFDEIDELLPTTDGDGA